MKIACSSCRYIGESINLAKGSRRKEVFLWCCLLLPGLLYTLWRQSSDGRYPGCPQCESSNIRALKRREWKHFQKTGQLPE
ncbi:MAG: hypothetical protein AUK55_09485 [Syntrophobacteraceae bacterium CG2_30_61_12]|nr:MAG: hypothetical protein AUK55_09485 [Syntrophobacteraceae bacterium CG2_30_61_12]PIU31034.1 MAG: hypothetical protein COT06_10290 [Syntrophobacteraceae bacterium CG07_land_8_20_14_0_80_61_8]